MSNNLNIDQMIPAQDQKETTHNDANGQIDAATTEAQTILVDSTNVHTMTVTELTRFNYTLFSPDTSAPTATVQITLPAIKRGLMVFANGTAEILTAGISSQTVTIPTMKIALVHSDGIMLRLIAESTGTASTFLGHGDTSASYSSQGLKGVRVNSGETALEFYVRKIDWNVPFNPGVPSSSEFMGRWVAPRNFEIPAGLTESQGHAGVAATAQTDFDLQQNGSSIGTIRFAAAATVATFIKASATVIAAGDRIDIIAPGIADATLADLTFTIMGEFI